MPRHSAADGDVHPDWNGLADSPPNVDAFDPDWYLDALRHGYGDRNTHTDGSGPNAHPNSNSNRNTGAACNANLDGGRDLDPRAANAHGDYVHESRSHARQHSGNHLLRLLH